MSLADHWYVGDDAGASNDTYISIYGTTTNAGYAETFTAGSSYSIGSVKVRIFKVGSPSGNFNVDIYACTTNVPSTAKPTGSSLANGNILANSVPTGSTGNDVTITLSSTVALTSGTMCAIVLTCPSGDASNMIRARCDNVSTLYANGSMIPGTGSPITWGTVNTTQDILFETYTGTVTHAVAAAMTMNLGFAASDSKFTARLVAAAMTLTSAFAAATLSFGVKVSSVAMTLASMLSGGTKVRRSQMWPPESAGRTLSTTAKIMNSGEQLILIGHKNIYVGSV
jgi:hypothetical protein